MKLKEIIRLRSVKGCCQQVIYDISGIDLCAKDVCWYFELNMDLLAEKLWEIFRDHFSCGGCEYEKNCDIKNQDCPWEECRFILEKSDVLKSSLSAILVYPPPITLL